MTACRPFYCPQVSLRSLSVIPHWPDEPFVPVPSRSAPPLSLPHEPSTVDASSATTSHQIKPVPSVASGVLLQMNGDEVPMLHSLPLKS